MHAPANISQRFLVVLEEHADGHVRVSLSLDIPDKRQHIRLLIDEATGDMDEAVTIMNDTIAYSKKYLEWQSQGFDEKTLYMRSALRVLRDWLYVITKRGAAVRVDDRTDDVRAARLTSSLRGKILQHLVSD